jgi:hypothetical protein
VISPSGLYVVMRHTWYGSAGLEPLGLRLLPALDAIRPTNRFADDRRRHRTSISALRTSASLWVVARSASSRPWVSFETLRASALPAVVKLDVV